LLDHLIIEPMSKDLILWRCLHGGALCTGNIDDPEPDSQLDWPLLRARNVPLLKKLIDTYGSTAIVARDRDKVVAMLRFYPKTLCSFSDAGIGFCLQQAFPAGPKEDLIARDFPPVEKLRDRTLFAHCMMVVSPEEETDRYRRKGLATRMVRGMIRWARAHGWRGIETVAYEEIPLLYAISGSAGRKFWEKLGFKVILQDREPGIKGELLEKVKKEAAAVKIPADRAANRYRMRLEQV
jgi:GNAT superfamily N-acetyltransferase